MCVCERVCERMNVCVCKCVSVYVRECACVCARDKNERERGGEVGR